MAGIRRDFRFQKFQQKAEEEGCVLLQLTHRRKEGDEWAERQVVMDESETSPLIGQLQAGLGLSRFWM